MADVVNSISNVWPHVPPTTNILLAYVHIQRLYPFP